VISRAVSVRLLSSPHTVDPGWFLFAHSAQRQRLLLLRAEMRWMEGFSLIPLSVHLRPVQRSPFAGGCVGRWHDADELFLGCWQRRGKSCKDGSGILCCACGFIGCLSPKLQFMKAIPQQQCVLPHIAAATVSWGRSKSGSSGVKDVSQDAAGIRWCFSGILISFLLSFA